MSNQIRFFSVDVVVVSTKHYSLCACVCLLDTQMGYTEKNFVLQKERERKKKYGSHYVVVVPLYINCTYFFYEYKIKPATCECVCVYGILDWEFYSNKIFRINFFFLLDVMFHAPN